MRTHGFQRPFHPLQITSWIVFTVDAAVFSAVGFPLLHGGAVAQAIVGLCYFISIVSLIFSAVKATRCNPQDPHLKRKTDKETFNRQELDELPYCEDCDCPVFPRSKHCRACDKCVHVFDHHCKWLNNCIGQYNYRYFIGAVVSVAVMTGIVLFGSISILAEFILDEDIITERLSAVGGAYAETPKEFVVAVLSLLTVVNLPLCFLDLQLVLFHVFLTSQQLTTFEYIMNKRDLELEDEERRERGDKPRPRALPSCIDWIVYKARKKKKAPAQAPQAEDFGSNPELGCSEETSVVPVTAGGSAGGGSSLNSIIASGMIGTDGGEASKPDYEQEASSSKAACPDDGGPSSGDGGGKLAQEEDIVKDRPVGADVAVVGILPPPGATPDAVHGASCGPGSLCVVQEGPFLEMRRPARPPLPPVQDDLPELAPQPVSSWFGC